MSFRQKKICVVTGSRAEYGLLYWTMLALKNSKYFKLQIIATGMHLSPFFGSTYKIIEKDGFKIDYKVNMKLTSDSEIAITKSIGIGTIGFADAYSKLKPDLVLVLGDRYELLSAVSAASIFRIPVAHCHGGEITEGAIDESIRHAVTKMSHLHFVSTKEHHRRVLQLGENPKSVVTTGAFGIENINKLKLMKKSAFQSLVGLPVSKRIALVTFHPVTLEHGTSKKQFSEILSALDAFPDLCIIFTKSNADMDGLIINRLIDQYVRANASRAVSFASMGQVAYLSALKYSSVIVGNSSSGILEAASFKLPCVNIGNRQKGRTQSHNVINCEPTKDQIIRSTKTALSMQFRKKIAGVKNVYDHGNASAKVIEKLRETDFKSLLAKKFYKKQF